MLDNTPHEAFFPPEANCTLWRFMDLWKFLSMLENRKLFFIRSDLFEDPYEGVMPHANVTSLCDPSQISGSPARTIEQIVSETAMLRRTMFINSWHMNEYESAAMWKLYSHNKDGVAICSNYDALARVLNQSIVTARATNVKYIDYDRVPLPVNNVFYRFIHKRMSFSHENELRAVIWALEPDNGVLISPESKMVGVGMAPEDLIKSVYLSPTSPEWFGELLEQVLHRYGLAIPVVRSTLYDRSLY